MRASPDLPPTKHTPMHDRVTTGTGKQHPQRETQTPQTSTKDPSAMQEHAPDAVITHTDAVTTLMEQGIRGSMEDRVAVSQILINPDTLHVMVGVFDGHGGPECAQYCQDELFFNIQQCREYLPNPEKALIKSFESIDRTLMRLGKKYVESGTTATVGAFRIPVSSSSSSSSSTAAESTSASASADASSGSDSKAADRISFSIAHVGDSRAVLVKSDKSVKELSNDHKGSRLDEQKRIENLGGVVSFDEDDNIHRVMGILAVTRAIGDFSLKPFVTAKPETATIDLVKGLDKYILISSDGLWDTVKNEDVAAVLLEKGRKQGAKDLVEMALGRGSDDNVGMVIVSIDELFEHAEKGSGMVKDIPEVSSVAKSNLKKPKSAAAAATKKREKPSDDVIPLVRKGTTLRNTRGNAPASAATEENLESSAEEQNGSVGEGSNGLDASMSAGSPEKKQRTKR